jgi:lipopolysaccharide cholinephosphotransferase
MEDFSKYNGEGTALRKAQLRMLDILIEVDKICRRHNITYWLDGGTCLGAVRHSGFIPWDDDLDIAVMRTDYKKLCNILKKELPDNLIFQDASTEKYYPCVFAKVRDKKSFLCDPAWNPKTKEQGLYIDIFPFERGNATLKKFIEFFYGRAFRRLHNFSTSKTEYIIALLMYPFSLLLVFFARISGKFTFKKSMINAYGTPVPRFYSHKYSSMLPVCTIIFEGQNFPAPANPDAYLRELYGDYMQIPPESQRIVHSTKIEFYD